MKKGTFLALLFPVMIFATLLTGGLDKTASADPGMRGGRASRVDGGFAGRGGGGFVGRGGGGFVGRGGGGFVGRGDFDRHGGFVGHGGRHGGFRGDIWIGPGWGFWDPFFYPAYPYYSYPYYPPQTIVVPQEPQEYILQTPQEQAEYWYYCKDPRGYYPQVRRCPGGWMKVVPSAPPEED